MIYEKKEKKKVNRYFLWTDFLKSIYIVFHVTPMMIAFNIATTLTHAVWPCMIQHMDDNKMEVHKHHAEPWKVTLVNTGENTLTGGRLKRVKNYIKNDSAFCFTYGDGLSNINISKEIDFHKSHGKMATIAAVQPPGRYGALTMKTDTVTGFTEKPMGDGGYINGGFFILSPNCIDLIKDDQTSWEGYPLTTLAKEKQLTFIATNIPRKYANRVFKNGFEMDTIISASNKKSACG